MSISRRDDFVTDAQGRALAGAQVYYCTQPASTSANPPGPLATVYSDTNGDPGVNPQITDGFGHAVAYLFSSQLYTVVVWHPLFGSNPVVLIDQAVPGDTATLNGLTPFQGVPIGTVNGIKKVFTLAQGSSPIPSNPAQATVWQNFPLIVNTGYTITGITITYTIAPISTDTLYAEGFY